MRRLWAKLAFSPNRGIGGSSAAGVPATVLHGGAHPPGVAPPARVCPACATARAQIEWFFEMVFTTQLLEAAQIRGLGETAPNWFQPSVEDDGEGSADSAAVRMITALVSSGGTTAVNYDRPDEAWAVLLSGLPEKITEDNDPADRQAFEALATYVTAIRVLARSVLKRARRTRPFLVLYTSKRLETEGSRFLDLLRADGLTPYYFPPLRLADVVVVEGGDEGEHDEPKSLPRALRQRGDDEESAEKKTSEQIAETVTSSWWSKLKIWQMTQFRRIVYLDGDMLALRSIESLFEIEADFAVPFCEDIIIGLMVIRPNEAIFQDLRATLGRLLKSKAVWQEVRSVDQQFQHLFWYFRGLQQSGVAEFDLASGAFLGCPQQPLTAEGKHRWLQEPHFEIPVAQTDYDSAKHDHARMNSPRHRFNYQNSIKDHDSSAADKAAQEEVVVLNRTSVEDLIWPEHLRARPAFSVCGLSFEFHLPATYPQVSRFFRYPERYPAPGNHGEEQNVFALIALRGARLLHWPGEKRKPWVHYADVARTPFDMLWWREYEALKNSDAQRGDVQGIAFDCEDHD